MTMAKLLILVVKRLLKFFWKNPELEVHLELESFWSKGVFSKPSGNYIVSFDLKFWLLAYFLILLSCAKFQQDWTTFIFDIL